MSDRKRVIEDLLAHPAWDELGLRHDAGAIESVRAMLAKAVAPRAKKLLLQTDGGSQGNPGPAGGGGILVAPDGMIVDSFSVYFGEATNNEAEYRALVEGLSRAIALEPEKLDIRIDSELLVKQIQGKYKVRKEHLRPLYDETMKLLSRLRYTIAHVPRAQNAEADALATRAIEENR